MVFIYQDYDVTWADADTTWDQNEPKDFVDYYRDTADTEYTDSDGVYVNAELTVYFDDATDTWANDDDEWVVEPSATEDSIDAAAGTYAITGTATTLGEEINAASSSYSLTGTDVTLDISLNSSAGTYLITGTEANLIEEGGISAESGTYSITGTDTPLAAGINAITSSYSVTGTDVTLGEAINADSGTYLITGTDAELYQPVLLDADPGTYSITGTAATFSTGLDAVGGTYAVTGALVSDGAGDVDGTLPTFSSTGEVRRSWEISVILPELQCEGKSGERVDLIEILPTLLVQAYSGASAEAAFGELSLEGNIISGQVGSLDKYISNIQVTTRTANRVDNLKYPTLSASATATTPELLGLNKDFPVLSLEAEVHGAFGLLSEDLPPLRADAVAALVNVCNLDEDLPGLRVYSRVISGATASVDAVLPDLQTEGQSYSVIISLEAYLPNITPGVVSGAGNGLTDNVISDKDRFDDTLLRYKRWA